MATPEPEPEMQPAGQLVGVPKTFRFNRNSVFKEYLSSQGWRAAADGTVAQLGHWDTIGNAGPANAEIDCWPRSSTNCIDNIWTHYKRIFAAGIEKDYPETFFEWRALDEATIKSSPIWFLKNVWGVHGKGITLVTDWEDYQRKVVQFPQTATWLVGPNGEKELIADTCYLQRGIWCATCSG